MYKVVPRHYCPLLLSQMGFRTFLRTKFLLFDDPLPKSVKPYNKKYTIPIHENCLPLVPPIWSSWPSLGSMILIGTKFYLVWSPTTQFSQKIDWNRPILTCEFLDRQKNSFLNFHRYMPEQLGFETMLIIDPWGMAFHAVGIIVLTFDFLFKMVSSYCEML